MPRAVTIHQAKPHFSKLADRAHAGDEILIAKGNVPWARLVPLHGPVPRQPGLLTGTVGAAFFEPLPEEELDAWHR